MDRYVTRRFPLSLSLKVACSQDAACDGFNWNKVENNCHLFSSNEDIDYDPDYDCYVKT